MSEQNMAFPIPNSVLEPYIKQAVSASIVAALGDGAKLIEAAVHQALTAKVNSQGKVSNYSSDNKFQIVEILAQEKIREVAREVVNDLAEQMRPKIYDAVEKQLRTKHTAIAKTLVDGMISSLSTKWNVSVSIEPPSKS